MDPGALVRFLAQRRELGVRDWIFEGLSRDEVLALIRMARGTGGRKAGAASRTPASEAGARKRSGRGPGASPAPYASPAPSGSTAPSASPASRTPARTPGGVTGGDDDLPREYGALREVALACTRCRLAEGRTQVVFSDGNPDARVMVVGEAPGANEDRTGLPFVGQAGKLLDLMLASVGLSRKDSVYICNVLKCRPPGNRNPLPDEIEACAGYLRRQIELVRPEAILAVGTFAAQLLTGNDIPLGRLRGKVYSYEGEPLVVTYHPAALLRNSTWTRAAWDDLQLLRQVLDDGST